jgi:hypothetical protein
VDWWIPLLTPYTVISFLQAIQRYRWFTQFRVHRYTRIRIPSLTELKLFTVTESHNHTLSLHKLTSNYSASRDYVIPTTQLASQSRILFHSCGTGHAAQNTSLLARCSALGMGADNIENTSSVRMRVYWPADQHWAWRREHRKHLFCSNACLLARCSALSLAQRT